MSINDLRDGGPAFPHERWQGYQECMAQREGMSLRDYFAAQALAGWLADNALVRILGSQPNPEDFLAARTTLAQNCYHMADAMLKERDK